MLVCCVLNKYTAVFEWYLSMYIRNNYVSEVSFVTLLTINKLFILSEINFTLETIINQVLEL